MQINVSKRKYSFQDALEHDPMLNGLLYVLGQFYIEVEYSEKVGHLSESCETGGRFLEQLQAAAASLSLSC